MSPFPRSLHQNLQLELHFLSVLQDWMLRVLSWDKGQKLNKKLNK